MGKQKKPAPLFPTDKGTGSNYHSLTHTHTHTHKHAHTNTHNQVGLSCVDSRSQTRGYHCDAQGRAGHSVASPSPARVNDEGGPTQTAAGKGREAPGPGHGIGKSRSTMNPALPAVPVTDHPCL